MKKQITFLCLNLMGFSATQSIAMDTLSQDDIAQMYTYARMQGIPDYITKERIEALYTKPEFPSTFNNNQGYRIKSHPEIYMVYLSVINDTIFSKSYISEPGFKIFKSSDKAEIGFLTTNYSKTAGEIRIGEIKINDAFQNQGYATKALETFMGLCKAKKANFPNVQRFSLLTGKENGAMIKVANKTGFSLLDVFVNKDDEKYLNSINQVYFIKPII